MKRGTGSIQTTAAFGLLIILGGVAGAVLADARDQYKAGLEQLEARDYGAAADLFRAAIAERAEERHHLLTSRRYYPHYYLGLALTERQNCRRGIESLTASKNQGKIQRSEDLFADLEQRLTACQKHLAAVEQAYGQVEGLLVEAENAGKTLEGLREKPGLAALWVRDQGALATRQGQAMEKLRSLRQLASTARQAEDLAALEGAQQGVGGVSKALRSLIAEAHRALGEQDAAQEHAAASALEQVEQNAASARQTLRGVRDLAPYPPQLADKVKTLEGLLAAVEELKGEGRAADFTDLDTKIAQARQQLLGAAGRPPDRLAEAVASFLQGEVQVALDLLEGEAFQDPRAEAHACILEAACRYDRYVSAGENSAELRLLAQQAARDCSALNPPRSGRFLSPRFLEFYQQALALSEEELFAENPARAAPGASVAGTDLVGEEFPTQVP